MTYNPRRRRHYVRLGPSPTRFNMLTTQQSTHQSGRPSTHQTERIELRPPLSHTVILILTLALMVLCVMGLFVNLMADSIAAHKMGWVVWQ
jgi:hypothetical protein